MSVGYTKLPQHFYITTPLPCPYLAGQLERKVITELRGPEADRLHDVLSQAGFRRSHSVAYIPACPSCNACIPVRLRADAFRPSRNQRKNINRNTDLVCVDVPPVATSEQFDLFEQYQESRHGDGDMSRMDFRDYRAMIEDTAVDSYIQEFRIAAGPDQGRLLACCLVDRLVDGLSAVYSFFDPEEERRSLGNFVILHMVKEAVTNELPYVYLGYLIRECRKMSYKLRYQPLEALSKEGWRLVASDDSPTQ